MRVSSIACAIVLASLAASTDSIAQSPADVQSIKQELDALRATQAAMQRELQEIKALLRQPSSPALATAGPVAGTELSLDDAHIKGATRAAVVLVEFSDFQCPFCARFAATSYAQISRDYVDTGRLRYAFVDFPIESLHPMAFREHVAANCAADEGRFWEMHDRLFANQGAGGTKALATHAAAIGLDAAQFDSCLGSESRAAAIRRAMKSGEAVGVTGTPTFMIGVMGPDNKFKASKIVVGAKPYSVFKDAIDAALATTVGWDEIPRPARMAVRP